MKAILESNKASNFSNHLTDQGAKHAFIIYQDKLTGEEIGDDEITNSKLARFYFEQRVIGRKRGRVVVEV